MRAQISNHIKKRPPGFPAPVVQAKARHQRLQLRVVLLQLLQPPDLAHLQTPYLVRQRYQVCPLIPFLRAPLASP